MQVNTIVLVARMLPIYSIWLCQNIDHIEHITTLGKASLLGFELSSFSQQRLQVVARAQSTHIYLILHIFFLNRFFNLLIPRKTLL